MPSTMSAERDRRRAAGELTADQVRVLQLLLAGWRLRDWNAGMAVRARHPADYTQRVEFGRSSLINLRDRRLVRARLDGHTQEWALTRAGRAVAAELVATRG